MTVLLVLAKAPVPGRVKTRLCPPADPAGAAEVAAAALLDTLDAVRAVPDAVPVLAHAGRLAGAVRAPQIRAALAGWHLLPQRGVGLDERLAHAHADAGAAFPGRPVLQIGMDTPQLGPDLLAAAASRLVGADAPDALLGPAADGGWWALGLRDPEAAAALRGVPMSTPDTGRLTRAALVGRGLRVALLPTRSDVDDWATALAVAREAAESRFARAVRRIAAGLPRVAGLPPVADLSPVPGPSPALGGGDARGVPDAAEPGGVGSAGEPGPAAPSSRRRLRAGGAR
nr:DUF2064 domain-containing protein [Micromonospora sp. MW-13]